MSIYRYFVTRFTGLDLMEAVQGMSDYESLDRYYQLKPTDHRSLGQVVVAETPAASVDGVSSLVLHDKSMDALAQLRELAR
ncbi:MAG: hypothetical protein IBX52_13165 [Bacterioplanes sp.]|nr:hypothetical protein [Bacterioplanes sp.]